MVWSHHGGGGTPALVCTCVFYTPMCRTLHSKGGEGKMMIMIMMMMMLMWWCVC